MQKPEVQVSCETVPIISYDGREQEEKKVGKLTRLVKRRESKRERSSAAVQVDGRGHLQLYR